MADFFTQLRAAVTDHIERFRNRDFFEATMAAAAMVSQADGSVNLTEASVIDQALEAVHELNIYDPHEAVDLYRQNIEELENNPEGAKAEILKTVSRVAGDEEAARTLIKICVAVGKADENFILEEKSRDQPDCREPRN